MSSKINLQTCEYARKSSIFQDNQLIFIKSGNIWMCIGYHFTWNVFQGIIYGMPVSGLSIPGIITTHFTRDNILNGGGFGIEGGILTTLVTLLSFLFVRYYYRNSTYDFMNNMD